MSLITIIVIFFALLFVPGVGPFIAILWLSAAGEAMYAPRPKREKQSDAEYLADKAAFEADRDRIRAANTRLSAFVERLRVRAL
jgi:hypothetical protein